MESTPVDTNLMETTSMMECGTIPAKKIDATPASAVNNVPTIMWKSILRPKETTNSIFHSLILSPRTQPTSANHIIDDGDTIKLTMRKPMKIMNSSILKLKKQEMSPWKKRMYRIIKTLKQTVRRKELKITSLQNLLKTL